MISNPLATPAQQPAPIAIAEDTNQLIELWLHGKSPHSQEAYRSDIGAFVAYTECRPLASITVNDLQGFAGALERQGYSVATQARKLSAVKSLLAYGNRIGLLTVNVGAVVKVPKGKDGLAQRILTEEEVLRMFAGETNPRNYALLRFLYATGARAGEVCALTWNDIRQDAKGHGLVTFFGKGSKTRNVIFRADVYKTVIALRQGSRADMPVFLSQKGGHLSTAHLHKIVAAAGKRAGIEGKVSPHWLRHSHASHSIARGCAIHQVQASLGHSSIETTGRYLHANPTDGSGLYLVV